MRRGTRIAQAYVSTTVDGDGMNEEIVREVDKAGPGVEKVGDEHGERYGDHFSEGFFARLRSKVSKRMSSNLSPEMDKVGKEAGERLGKSMIDSLRTRLAGADDLVERLTKMLDADNGKNKARQFALTKELRLARGEADRLERALRSVMRTEGLLGSAVSGNRRDLARDTGLTSIDDWLRGTRSRNNAIHFFTQLLGGMIRTFERGLLLGKTFADNLSKVEEGAGFLQKLAGGFGLGGAGGEAGGLGGMLKGVGAAAPSAAAGLLAVVAAASVLVSVLGALLAIITALAATIVSALVGALAVAGGAILAVVAAGGLLTAAFMSMTDAQQNLLKGAFLPIKEEMVGIAQIMLRDIVPAFAVWSRNIQQALLLLAPLSAVMGRAFAQAGTIFTQALSGPGFQQFSAALTTYLPGIVNNLSRALGGFLNGMLSLFAALLPLVAQFANWLARVATDFARWASSTQGQNSIVDFAGRAVASLQALWGFVTSFVGAIGRLLFSPQAQAAGNTIFTGLARAFDALNRKIQQASRNGDLKKWFDDAVKFGGQLWSVIQALLKTFTKLYDSGVLKAVGMAIGTVANLINALNVVLGPLISLIGKSLVPALSVVLAPLNATASAIIAIGNAVKWVLDLFSMAGASISSGHVNGPGKGGIGSLLQNGITGRNPSASTFKPAPPAPSFNVSGLISSGTSALNATSVGSGGFRAPSKKQWKNPYVKFARSLIAESPSIRQQIRNAVIEVNKAVIQGIKDAASATTNDDVVSALQGTINSIAQSATDAVQLAQDQLNSAAQDLLNASSPKEARKALREVRKAQKNMKLALAEQTQIVRAEKILAAQGVVNPANVTKLLDGVKVTNATLADYAEARGRVADMLDDANQKLADAISLRDDYVKQVSDSVKQYGSLVTAQAQVIDGVTQALTANDIVTNLQDRLNKIQTFQSNLRLLLAQGLSQDAYKQIVDAGVDAGSAYAQALVNGGQGAISEVNGLVGQISGIANQLGTDASSFLYQAGVDAAQGLVDGLTSLSAQLDAAAVRLGNSIAAAIQRTLGIKSPSRVLRGMMAYVGDGAVLGLDDQHVKVGNAAARLAAQIAVTPEAARYAGASAAPVSGNGNDPRFRDLIVQTPTENPKAVAMEVLNEVTGRI